MSDLCRITGVSERTLQYAFSDHFGISPNRYLREVRLNTVHKALARASFGDVKVTDIANNYGFWHMPVCRRFQTPVQKVAIRGAEKNIQSVFIITFKQLPVKCVYTAQRIKKTTKKEYPDMRTLWLYSAHFINSLWTIDSGHTDKCDFQIIDLFTQYPP